ncbi:hypothetical protein GG851_04810 [Bordetella petrii]|nr:hypothetical protein [Bordetella petrii]
MRRILSTLCIALAVQAGATAAEFPGKPVQIVVPYSPGGLTDNIARLYAERLAARWQQPVVVENKPGAGASLGAAYVSRSDPDGYTLLVGSVGMVTNPYMLKTMPYDPKTLAPLGRIALAPNVLYVHPSLPVKTVGELIAYARANPGKVSFASSGIGSSPHLAAELFANRAKIDVLQVPYKGTGAAIADFLGGQVNAYFDTMQSMTYADAGKIRALGVATSQRLPDRPDLPTVNEAGGLTDIISSSWFGFYLPAGVPEAVRQKIENDLKAVSEAGEVREKISGMGLVPAYQSADEFAQFNAEEGKRWGGVIKSQGITVQ